MWGIPLLYFVLALIVGLLSISRLVRLMINDKWPPVLAIRDRWLTWTAQTERRSGWEPLLSCGWCFAPWVTLIVGGWAVISHLHWAWWLVNGWLAVSYVASWLWFHDEDGSAEDDDA